MSKFPLCRVCLAPLLSHTVWSRDKWGNTEETRGGTMEQAEDTREEETLSFLGVFYVRRVSQDDSRRTQNEVQKCIGSSIYRIHSHHRQTEGRRNGNKKEKSKKTKKKSTSASVWQICSCYGGRARKQNGAGALSIHLMMINKQNMAACLPSMQRNQTAICEE